MYLSTYVCIFNAKTGHKVPMYRYQVYKNKKIKIHRSQIHGKSALKNMDSQGDDKTPLHKI